MSRALVRRKQGIQISGETIIIIALAALLVWWLMKRQSSASSYSNLETWKIEWDEKTMLPTKVEVHRDAKRQ
jgi:flagellar biogenesis protein FliO